MTTNNLQSQLKQLIEQWRKASDSGQKAKFLQRILSRMDRSGKIWRDHGLSRDLYEEALQKNWLWFTENLADYDPTRASVMGWFNQYLKWKIADEQKQRYRETQKRWQPAPNVDGKISTVDDLSSDHFSSDQRSAVGQSTAANDFQHRLNQMKHCVSCHQPQLRRRSMRGRPEVSCDRILAALLDRVKQVPSSEAMSDIFAQLAADWQLDRDTFRRFCSSSCFQLIRRLCSDTPSTLG